MKIEKFFENVFVHGLDENKIKAVEEVYGGKIQESTAALIVSCMRERTLIVDGETNRCILLTLDEILKPNTVFTKAKILPLFKADEDRYICYNFNASEKNKIADSCLFNLKTNEIEQQYPGFLLFFKNVSPEQAERAKQKNCKFQSLMFLTSDTKIAANFGYDIIEGQGVQIKTVYLGTETGDILKNVDILVPFNPTEKFDKMMTRLKQEKESYQVELDMLKADWPKQLIGFVESRKFTTKAMLEKIKDIDLYANMAPIYETVLEKIENKEIFLQSPAQKFKGADFSKRPVDCPKGEESEAHKKVKRKEIENYVNKAHKENLPRMSFCDFNILFLQYSGMDKLDVSVYAPIIYDMKDEYFDAVLKYLKTEEKTNLTFGELSINDIISGYSLSAKDYIKAVVVLYNIEQHKQYAFDIYNPDIIE